MLPNNLMQAATELLLLCASPLPDALKDSRIGELLNAAPDWVALLELADSHRLTQLLYWAVERVSPGSAPPELRDRFSENTRNNLFRTAELFRLLDLLESEAIPAIPFKGPTLAVQAYRNVALRLFDDLDILVRPADIWRARDLLLNHGYQTRLSLRPDLQAAYLRSYDEIVLSGQDGESPVELHSAFLPPRFSVPLDTAPLFARCTPVSFGAREIMALNCEDLLLVLCLHGSKHCWSHLGLVCDVAWLMAGRQFDWETALSRAESIGSRRMVLLGVHLASCAFHVPSPEFLARAIAADPAVTKLSATVEQALFGTRHDETAILRSALLHMRMRKRLRDRARYAFRLLARPGLEDWRLLDLPRPLHFLYAVLRFPRLALKYRSRGNL